MSLPEALSEDRLARLPGGTNAPGEGSHPTVDAQRTRGVVGRAKALLSRVVARVIRSQVAPLDARVTELHRAVNESMELTQRLRHLEVTVATLPGRGESVEIAALRTELADLRGRLERLEGAAADPGPNGP